MTDRELLRLHLEAVWNITLPELNGRALDVVLTGSTTASHTDEVLCQE